MRCTSGPEKERFAIERDGRDIGRIQRVTAAVTTCLCQMAIIDPLEHPDSRWHPDDLRDALRGTLLDLDGELKRINCGVLVLGPDVTFEEPS